MAFLKIKGCFLSLAIIACHSLLWSQSSDQVRYSYEPNTSLMGFSGLLFTPSAYVANWKTVQFGGTHFHKNAAFTFEKTVNSERAFWVNLGFLPFGEVGFKLTRPYKPFKLTKKNYGIGDRSTYFRLQLFKETKNRPALLVGIQDPFSASSYFNTNYLVASKTIKMSPILLVGNVGYGFKIEEARGHVLQGLFGGVQANWKQWILLAEYDTEQLNTGVGYWFRKKLHVKVALIDLKYLSATISCRFTL